MNTERALLLLGLVGIVLGLATFFPFDNTSERSSPKTGAKTQTITTVIVVIRPGSFVEGTKLTYDPPHVKVVLGVNNTVLWVNGEKENISHDVTHEECFSQKPGCIKDFVSKLFPPGESFQYTFTSKGLYRYVCAAHPWMRGEVLVVEK